MESCCYICVVNFLAFPITGLCHRSPGMFLFPDRVSISLKLYSPVQLLGFMSPNFAFNLYSSIFFPNISVSHLGTVPEKKPHEVAVYHTVASVFQCIGSNGTHVSEQPRILDPSTYDHSHFKLKHIGIGCTMFVWNNVRV